MYNDQIDTVLGARTSLSDAGVAQRFVEAMHQQWLPPLYKLGSVDMPAVQWRGALRPHSRGGGARHRAYFRATVRAERARDDTALWRCT